MDHPMGGGAGLPYQQDQYQQYQQYPQYQQSPTQQQPAQQQQVQMRDQQMGGIENQQPQMQSRSYLQQEEQRPQTSKSADFPSHSGTFSPPLGHQHPSPNMAYEQQPMQNSRPPSQQSNVNGHSGYQQDSRSSSQGLDNAKPNNNVVIKVGMVGDAQIGKTSLMVKYVEGNYDEDYIQTLGMPRNPLYIVPCLSS